MKHIQLFESFLAESAQGGSQDFQFFPFDNQKEPASKYNLPENLSSKELLSLAESDSNIPDSAWQPGQGTGLYISHAKLPSGFLRGVVRSVSPLKIDFTLFNDQFENLEEKLGVTKGNLGKIMQETGGLRFLSNIRQAMPEVYNYLGGDSKASQLAADAGELYF